MYFAVISIFEMFATIREFGITGRAVTQKQVTIECINPRDFTSDNYRRIDERPYGGGPGMVMMAEPLSQAIEDARLRASQHGCRVDKAHCPVIYMSPQGQTLSESSVVDMTEYDGMIILCGRYEGIDERLLSQYVDMEISLGDYVLTGGELPAMVLMDSVIRRLPDIMGDDKSAEQDSFVDGLIVHIILSRMSLRVWQCLKCYFQVTMPILRSGALVSKSNVRKRVVQTYGKRLRQR